MTGNPERLALLDKATKDRIGSFYLSNLLEADGTGKWPIFLDSIDRFIAQKSHVRIPIALASKLELGLLDWGVFPSDENLHRAEPSLPLLFVGRPARKRPMDDDFERACATIEIARRIDFGKNPKETPFALRIAGVTKEGRIVAATYDLEDNNRLAELNVSMPFKECPPHLNDYWDTDQNLRPKLVAPLLDRLHPYAAAGLITQRMCEIVRTMDPKYYPHTNALVFQLTQSKISIGKPLDGLDIRRLAEQAVKLGYFAERTVGIVTVGLTGEAAQQRGIAPWEISLPASLSKA